MPFALIADRTAKLPWSRMLLRLLLEDIRIDDLFLDVVGKPEALPVNRYPQAVATALALRHSWQRDDLITFSKRLGVKVTSKDLADHARLHHARSEDAQSVVGPAAQDAEQDARTRHSTRRSRTHP